MQGGGRPRALVLVLLVVVTAALVMVVVAPGGADPGTPGPLAAVDFVAASTNDDGSGGDGDDGGPATGYDAWGAASSADPSEPGPGAARVDADVAMCRASVRGADPNLVDVAVVSGYPGYVCTFNVTVDNASGLPASLSPAVLSADPGLEIAIAEPLLPTVLGPGEQGEAAFSVTVLQSAARGAVLRAGVAITVTADHGRILVDKVTDPPGSTQVFEFEPDWGEGFLLTDGAAPYDSGPLLPGEYSLAEVNLPEDWVLTSSRCVVDGDPDAPVMDASLITVQAGKTVICTFENFEVRVLGPEASLIIVKDARPADDTAFRFDGGSLGAFSLRSPAARSVQFTELEAGRYRITELGPVADPLWQLVKVECIATQWSVSGATVTVDLTPGEAAACTFYNARELPYTGSPARTMWAWAAGLAALLAGVLLLIAALRREER